MSVFSHPVRLDFKRLEAYATQRHHAANVREVAAFDSYLSYCKIVKQQPLSLENWRYHQTKLFGSPSNGAGWKELGRFGQ
jgi:hypothetical protein